MHKEANMKLWSDSLKDGGAIPGEFAFGVIDPVRHVALSANKNPHLAWSDLPAETRSLALLCHDMDVPSRGDDVNQEGRSVPADLPRVDFFHWVLIDLPLDTPVIAVGQYSNGITPHGKSGPEVSNGRGARQGLNDYTNWFAGDADMAGEYFGYDGPCPPWNDSIVHRYVFSLYALDIERVPVDGKFTGQQVRDAIKGHVLAEACIMGRYTLTPALRQIDVEKA
jgi:Raf kinase inhibitor-like YbhB/YbcL family protein